MGQTLVLTDYWWVHWGHKPFSKLLGAAWPLQPHLLAPMPMLHVPIRFEISTERKSIPCSSIVLITQPLLHTQLCTYMFLIAVDVATIALSHLVRGSLYRWGQSMPLVLISIIISSPTANDSEISLLNSSA